MTISRHAIMIFAMTIFLGFGTSLASAAGSTAIAAVITKIFADDATSTGSNAVDANFEIVRDYYASRNFKPVWTRDTGPKGKGKALFEELKRSSVHGLSPSFYNVEEIDELIGKLGSENLARLDLLLSGSFIEYAHDLKNGRIGADKAPQFNKVAAISFAANYLIEGAADAGNLRNFAKSFLTTDDRYIRLIAKYVEFDRMEAAGVWPAIPADGAEVKAGDSDKRMVDIRRLLAFSGDLPAEFMEDGSSHDDNTVEAIKRFQERNGIDASGRVDQRTLVEMSVPLAQRKTQILINLERRRWQNRMLGENSLYINLADHSGKLVRKGKTRAFLKILPNKEHEQVPTFFGKIKALQFGENGLADIKLVVETSSIGSASNSLPVFSVGYLGEEEFHNAFGDNLSGEIDINQNETIELTEPLELYVTYLTAWANKNGSVHFRPDVFHRDEELAKLLRLN